MPATAQWYDEKKTIVLETFQGQWSWSEFSDCISTAIDLIASIDSPVYGIADYSQSDTMPMSGSAIKIARDVMRRAPANWVGIVIVSQNHLIRTMVNLFRSANKSFGNKVYLVGSIDEAVAHIQTLIAAQGKDS